MRLPSRPARRQGRANDHAAQRRPAADAGQSAVRVDDPVRRVRVELPGRKRLEQRRVNVRECRRRHDLDVVLLDGREVLDPGDAAAGNGGEVVPDHADVAADRTARHDNRRARPIRTRHVSDRVRGNAGDAAKRAPVHGESPAGGDGVVQHQVLVGLAVERELNVLAAANFARAAVPGDLADHAIAPAADRRDIHGKPALGGAVNADHGVRFGGDADAIARQANLPTVEVAGEIQSGLEILVQFDQELVGRRVRREINTREMEAHEAHPGLRRRQRPRAILVIVCQPARGGYLRVEPQREGTNQDQEHHGHDAGDAVSPAEAPTRPRVILSTHIRSV